jgi:hypothetical protein
MAPLEEGSEQNNASVRLVEPNDLAPQGSHRQWSNRNAYNETRVEEAKALPGLGMPGVLMRWTEHVNDMTRQPLDKRVGKDSIALHGQLRLPGDPFYDIVNRRSVKAPPNRPNDRAVVTVWRVTWGEPTGGLDGLDAERRQAWEQAKAQLQVVLAPRRLAR